MLAGDSAVVRNAAAPVTAQSQEHLAMEPWRPSTATLAELDELILKDPLRELNPKERREVRTMYQLFRRVLNSGLSYEERKSLVEVLGGEMPAS